MFAIKPKVLTQKDIDKMTLKYYGGGNELIPGDIIYTGFINMYANLNGIPQTKYHKEEHPSLALTHFTIKNGFLYQLYCIENEK